MDNDSRRYFNSEELEKELVPSMMRLDKYFQETRKYILEKYNIKSDTRMVENNIQPQSILKKLTSNPQNLYRVTEGEKQKSEYLQAIHRNLGTNHTNRKQSS